MYFLKNNYIVQDVYFILCDGVNLQCMVNWELKSIHTHIELINPFGFGDIRSNSVVKLLLNNVLNLSKR